MKASKHQATVDAELSSVASLGEPLRRRLYRFVIGQPDPVSREQAAAGIDVAHHVAKFHLDKLEEDGLLEVEYRRPAGRTGPGAGRPAKFYRRASRDISISLPERHYDLAAQVLADAIIASQTSGVPMPDALQTAARRAGTKLGEHAQATAGSRPSRTALVGAVCEVLESNGYEPNPGRNRITLTNCPFHALAEKHTELVCGMNLDLIGGMLDQLPQADLTATLDPAPDRCCVIVTKSAAAHASS